MSATAPSRMKSVRRSIQVAGAIAMTIGGAVAADTRAVDARPALEARELGTPQQESAAGARPTRALAAINVSFKLDPRLTQSLYMGDRWVSPPTYTRVGEGTSVTVPARAQGVDNRGILMAVQPEWRSTDPEMVVIAPTQGREVSITVQRAGSSRIQVVSQGVSKELSINAVMRDKMLQIEIAQQ